MWWNFLLACKHCFWRHISQCKLHDIPYKLAVRNCSDFTVKFNYLK